jgi:hypothetical protein
MLRFVIKGYRRFHGLSIAASCMTPLGDDFPFSSEILWIIGANDFIQLSTSQTQSVSSCLRSALV